MSAFGVAFIGNVWALTMFGVGLLVRGYSTLLFNNSWFAAIIPGGDISQGICAAWHDGRRRHRGAVQVAHHHPAARRARDAGAGRSPAEVRRALGLGSAVYLLIAVVIALARRPGGAAFARHARAVPGLCRVRRLGARVDRRARRDAFRLVPRLCGGADHAGDRHADRFPPGGARAAGRFLGGDRPGLRRHGLRPEGGPHAARLRQRSRVRTRRPPSAALRGYVRLRRRRRGGAGRLSRFLRAEPCRPGGPRLRRDHQGRRLRRGGVVPGDVGDPRRNHSIPRRTETAAWHPARDRIADPVPARRLGGADRHRLPRRLAAPRPRRGHGGVRRRA